MQPGVPLTHLHGSWLSARETEHADVAWHNGVAREGHGDLKAVWQDTVIV